MKHGIILTLICALITGSVYSKPVNVNRAQKVGQSFLKFNTGKAGATAKNLQLRQVPFEGAQLRSGNLSQDETADTPEFYIFSTENEGYVIVSGDDRAIPVLGYSESGSFDPDNVPPNMQKWLEHYKNEIRHAIAEDLEQDNEIQKEWSDLEEGKEVAGLRVASAVSPLLKSTWNQSPYYNQLCPSGTPTGCVATAMAQIMRYWSYPATGQGSHSYRHNTYGTLSANFGGTTYNWSNMPATLNAQSSSASVNAVATLMSHCGISVDMNYQSGGSGASIFNAMTALKTYFKYKSTCKSVKKSNYSATEWLNLLKNELSVGRPVIYAGDGSGGHAFVCDGYNSNNYFHFNWGWGGSYDDYFSLSSLRPNSRNYSNNNEAVIGIEPTSGSGGSGGGGQTGSFDLKMYESNLTVSASRIQYGSEIKATAKVANYGNASFSGEIGAAVYDASGNFVEFLQKVSVNSMGSQKFGNYTFTHRGGSPFIQGNYTVYMYFKTSSGDWQIIPSNTNASNNARFEVYAPASVVIEKCSNVTIKGAGKLIRGQSATINVDVVNKGTASFSGKFRVSLLNADRTLAQTVYTTETKSLSAGYHYNGGLDFMGAITVSPGTYLLSVDYQRTGETAWTMANGTSQYSNPVQVIVEAPAIQSDAYEPNNSQSQATGLSLNFSSNNAQVNTGNTNFHNDTDMDYYKIVLPAGYKYTVTPRLHDKYDSGNGQTYTADAKFSYSRDNSGVWSTTYDDVMPSGFTIDNGGTVYFKVAPYFDGVTGTYQFEIKVSRVSNSIAADSYEVNNTQAQASSLSLTFSGNSAEVRTSGANIHTSGDLDYYKVTLPAGYNYILTPRLHDKDNSANGQTYTVDAKFSYAVNNGSWSNTYDYASPEIKIDNGGTVYFKVESYSSGMTGTYLLEIKANRTVYNPGDAYEVNDTEAQATNLTLNFSGNTAKLKTAGATLHSANDVDYYKITFPAGYLYDINVHMYDKKNSPSGQSYTANTKLSSRLNNANWKNYYYYSNGTRYDETQFNASGIAGTRTLYIRVEPTINTGTGSYLLDIEVTRIANTLGADIYEPNNYYDDYILPLTFSGNSASVNTAGSNLHSDEDDDGYGLDLPVGYDYIITANLYDKLYSTNGQSYTADVTGECGLWAECQPPTPFDNTLSYRVTNGGYVPITIHGAKESGVKGTYLLDIKVTRTVHTRSLRASGSGDAYEVNDTPEKASELPLTFENGYAHVNTVEADFHTESDLDYYIVELPAGMNYIVTPVVQDALYTEAGCGESFTANAMFSYAIDNTDVWSDIYDDVMPEGIRVENGGKLYFKLEPYFSTGTYMFDIHASVTGKTGLLPVARSGQITLYPNPVRDILHISTDEQIFAITVFDLLGKIVLTGNSSSVENRKIDVSMLNNGMYLLMIETPKGSKTMKFNKI